MEKKTYIKPFLNIYSVQLNHCITVSTGDDDDERGPQSAPAFHGPFDNSTNYDNDSWEDD